MLTKARIKFKQLYFPGLISLVFLPMICVFYLMNNGMLQKYHVMEAIWFNTQNLKIFKEVSPDKIDNINTYRNYKPISFNGDPGHDAEERSRLIFIINKLVTNQDMVNGAIVTFGNHGKYEDLVSTIDLEYQYADKNIRLLLYNDKIFVWYRPLVKIPNVIQMHPTYDDLIRLPSPQPLSWGESAYDIALDFWPSILAFIAMLYFAFSKKRYYLFGKAT